MNRDDLPPDAAALGMDLAKACVPAFVGISHHLDQAERIEFLRAFLCTCSGMVQQSVGHDATRELFEFVAQMRPVAPLSRLN